MDITYSINGEPITEDKLKNIQITKKDYIDYIETIKKKVNISTEENMDIISCKNEYNIV